MPTNHALLAPSAAKRWLTCAPSAQLESKVPSRDTVFSIEGTYAHSLAELLLNRYIKAEAPAVIDALSDVWKDKGLADNDPEVGELKRGIEEAGFDFWEMLDYVHDNYVAIVWEDFLVAKQTDPEAELLVEAELKLDEFIPEGFGSSDAVLIYNNILQVYDLKYGRGVKVDADHNPQMMCYALGALYGPGEAYNIDTVRMTIIQPRLKHVSYYETTFKDLCSWGFNYLKPRAEAAFAGWGEFVPGEHCKFCRAAATCQALLSYTEKALVYNPEEAINDDQFGELVLSKVETVKIWVNAVEDYALNALLQGRKLTGWKLVEGRSIRKISEPEKAAADLAELGWDAEQIYKPRELRPISDLEKMVGKKNFPAILGKYVEKPQGKPVIAPVNDPRPEYSTAEKDFADNL